MHYSIPERVFAILSVSYWGNTEDFQATFPPPSTSFLHGYNGLRHVRRCYLTTILIVDDAHFAAEGMREYFEDFPDLEVIGIARTGEAALELLEALQPDVVVLDYKLPDELSGPEVAAEIQARGWPVRVLAFSAFDTPEVVEEMIEAGARGYFLKGDDPKNMLAAVRAVAAGNVWFSQSIGEWVFNKLRDREEGKLTPRQVEIMELVAMGMTNQHIALTLEVKKRTIDFQMERILRKLGADNRTEACTIARKKGWLR